MIFLCPYLSISLSRGALSYYTFSNTFKLMGMWARGGSPRWHVSAPLGLLCNPWCCSYFTLLAFCFSIGQKPFHQLHRIGDTVKGQASSMVLTWVLPGVIPSSCHKTYSFLIMSFILLWCRRGSSFALLLVSLLKVQCASVVASHVLWQVFMKFYRFCHYFQLTSWE